MSRSKSRKSSRSAPAPADGGGQGTEKPAQHGHNLRETIESIAIAFILAFLFRTFEAEAFVIPTGSMAPTLQGRHKDVECPRCDYRVRASASSEESQGVKELRAGAGGSYHLGPGERERAIRGFDVVTCNCPMCGYSMSVDPYPRADMRTDPEVAEGAEQPSFNGDRILVGKFVYAFQDPERFDVIVFKYPGDAKMNYIKRLLGLPGEELMIRDGDVFVRPAEDSQAPFEIVRKPPHKLLAMLQDVHDNGHNPRSLIDAGWPLRWQVRTAGGGGDWVSHLDPDSKPNVLQTFSIDGSADADRWIRYFHYVPDASVWQAVAEGSLAGGNAIRPRLITDSYAYNDGRTRVPSRGTSGGLRGGQHWVGDLAVECDVDVESTQGELLLLLVEGGRQFTCRIDLASGVARLAIDGTPTYQPTGQTAIRAPGRYHLMLANVDDQLLLWVDGGLVEFDATTHYTRDGPVLPAASSADPGDLAPAGIGSRGAALRVGGLRVSRDIYYIAEQVTPHRPGEPQKQNSEFTPLGDMGFFSDPSRWGQLAQRRPVTFKMGPDQFFVLGDNSPYSKDSRLWGTDGLPHYVDRELLIGKALFIYWPHSWDRVPGSPIPFPFFPNFSDMGFVR